MGRNSVFSREFEDDGVEVYNPEEDSLPQDILVLKRRVDVKSTGRIMYIEAHITKQEDQDDGVTWLKLYDGAYPDNFTHCYIDTINGELILDAIENYVRAGKAAEVSRFFQEEGRTVRDPVAFRLKLDTVLGTGSAYDDVNDMF